MIAAFSGLLSPSIYRCDAMIKYFATKSSRRPCRVVLSQSIFHSFYIGGDIRPLNPKWSGVSKHIVEFIGSDKCSVSDIFGKF